MEERQRWCDRTQWIYLYFHSNVTMGEIPSSCEAVKAGTAGSLLGGPGCCQAAFLVRYIWEYTMPQQVHAIRGGISEIAGGCQFFSKWCCPGFFFFLCPTVYKFILRCTIFTETFSKDLLFLPFCYFLWPDEEQKANPMASRGEIFFTEGKLWALMNKQVSGNFPLWRQRADFILVGI